MVYWRQDKPKETPKSRIEARRLILTCGDETPISAGVPFAARVTCMAEIATEPIGWLWGQVIPRRKVTTLTGAVGVGKSYLTLDIVAELTRGEGTSSQCQTDEPRNVLLISSEDDLTSVVGSRLKQSGADLARVHALRGLKRSGAAAGDKCCWMFQLNEDLRLLELEILRHYAEKSPLSLIVIDPFPTELFVGSKGMLELRRTIKHLAELATWSEAAILLVASRSPDRQGASESLVKELEEGVPSAWTVVSDFDTAERRLLLPIKTNLIKKGSGLSFRIEDRGVVWEPNPVEMTAEEYRAESMERARTPLFQMECSELARAKDWLQRRLKSDVVAMRIIKADAAANDISYSTLCRAFCALRGIPRRIENSRNWEWSLPAQSVVTSEDDEEGAARVAGH